VSSDEDTGSSLPALGAPIEPPLPIREAMNDLIFIPETPGLPSPAVSSAIPSSVSGRLAASGGRTVTRTGAGLSRGSNFEGFHDKNDLCELSMSSTTSEDEILTPAQRPGTQKNKRKFTEFTKQVETLASDSSRKVIIIEPVADDCPVEIFFCK
jgi:hypothetical protein